MQSIKLLSIRHLRICFSAPPRYMTPGKQTMAAVPSVASHERLCMMNARSAFDFGASTPGDRQRGHGRENQSAGRVFVCGEREIGAGNDCVSWKSDCGNAGEEDKNEEFQRVRQRGFPRSRHGARGKSTAVYRTARKREKRRRARFLQAAGRESGALLSDARFFGRRAGFLF